MTRRLLAGAMVVAIVVSACGSTAPPGPSPSPSLSPATGEPSPTPTAVVSTPSLAPPTPTPVPVLDIFLVLPRVELADVDATAVCDPDMSLAVSGAGETTVDCSESLRLALRALRTVTPDPVVRIYLRRPPCPSLPCSEDQLNTGEVTLWTATRAYSVWLDSRLRTVPLPSVTNDAAWPAAGNSPVPAVARPSIESAPPEVSGREPYPYCGWAVVDDPLEPLRCFRDAVVAGRRAGTCQAG